MEYSIREVAEMTGVSTRTLRYYDAIDLLKPLYTNNSGYRYYGEEIRQKYGEDTVRESNAKMMKMTEEEYQEFQRLETEIKEELQTAVREQRKPSDAIGKEIAIRHRQWLSMTWGQYSQEAHRGLTELYIQDERFLKYYDAEVSGCAKFLKEAVHFWIQ